MDFGATLGPSLAYERTSGATLGHFGVTLRSLWGDFGITLGSLLAYEGDLGVLWRHFVAILACEGDFE